MKKDRMDPVIVEEREALCAKYSINKYPATVVIDPKNPDRILFRMFGFDKKGPTLFVRKLNESLGRDNS